MFTDLNLRESSPNKRQGIDLDEEQKGEHNISEFLDKPEEMLDQLIKIGPSAASRKTR